MCSHRLNVAKVMVLLDEAVEQRLLRCPAYLTISQRAQVHQPAPHWCHVDLDPARTTTLGERVRHHPADRWQLNVPGALKRQHQAPADHVLQGAVCLPPVPCLTQLLRQRPPARSGSDAIRARISETPSAVTVRPR